MINLFIYFCCCCFCSIGDASKTSTKPCWPMPFLFSRESLTISCSMYWATAPQQIGCCLAAPSCGSRFSVFAGWRLPPQCGYLFFESILSNGLKVWSSLFTSCTVYLYERHGSYWESTVYVRLLRWHHVEDLNIFMQTEYCEDSQYQQRYWYRCIPNCV